MDLKALGDLGPRAELLMEKHAQYIRSFSKIWENSDRLEHVATEHFWMSGMYWGLSAMYLMDRYADTLPTAQQGWQSPIIRTRLCHDAVHIALLSKCFAPMSVSKTLPALVFIFK